MIDVHEYQESLSLCDVDTICQGFDYALLCGIWCSLKGRFHPPKRYTSRDLATDIKNILECRSNAMEVLKQIGLYSKEDVISAVDKCKTADALVAKYYNYELEAMYAAIYYNHPRSAMTTTDVANTLMGYVRDMHRANALLRNG